MKRELNIVVNGESYNFFIEPKTLLVQVLRETLGLTGTHQACDSSSCAACTVIVDGKAVKSCSVLALQVNGKEVTTIEGLADGTVLHPIQQAFIDNWAFQCGFCTSGQIMAVKAFLDENPDPKSSIAMRMPICLSLVRVAIAESIFCIATFSVISSSAMPGSMPAAASAASTMSSRRSR